MKIAILGLGTIGYGVYTLAAARADIQVKRVLDVKVWMDGMTDSIDDILTDEEITCVVETMGGLHPAYEYARACIEKGKSYITANKKMLSVYGAQLHALALEKNVGFLFSAACGGGIPYLANLAAAREYDIIGCVGGIVNGTTNFMLDSMQRGGQTYPEALARAQSLGYAERDPSGDVMGQDSMQKLILACAVAFGVWLDPAQIPVAGIQNLRDADMACFQEMGRVPRLVVKGASADGGIGAYVEPTLFLPGAPECAVYENLNYCWYEGRYGGRMAFSGQGAGRYPTAANIMRDLNRLLAGEGKLLPDDMRKANVAGLDARPYYARVKAEERTDSLRAISERERQVGDWRIITTIPVSVSDMHAIMDSYTDAFFASIN